MAELYFKLTIVSPRIARNFKAGFGICIATKNRMSNSKVYYKFVEKSVAV